jgi:hypothetical protein
MTVLPGDPGAHLSAVDHADAFDQNVESDGSLPAQPGVEVPQ